MNTDNHDLTAAVKLLATTAESRLTVHPPPEELAAYHRGELEAAQERRLQGHLALCRECTALLIDLTQMLEKKPPADGDEWAAAWPAMQRRLADTEPEPSLELGEPRSFGSPQLAYALAAALFLAVLGLGGWNLALRQALEQQTSPRFNVVIHDLEPQNFARAAQAPTKTLELPAGGERFVLILTPTEKPPSGEIVGRILNQDGRVVWRSRGVEPTDFGNFTLEVSRRFLPAGRYRIELLLRDAEQEEPLDAYEVELTYR